MKIQVIGSGSMWTKYNSACYLVDDMIMVDFPNGTCKYLYRLNIVPNKINNIILTHFHGDHYFDMPFYLLNKSKSDNKDVNIFCSKEGKKKINKIGILAFPNSFKEACNSLNLKYCFNNDFMIEDYKVHKLLVEHGRMKPAFGYIFSKCDISVGFTGDTSFCESVEIMSKKCSYLFCDCMFINGNGKHQGIDNLEYLSKKYPKCTFVVSHLEDVTREKLKKMNIQNIIVPDDGQIIKI
ncbi:MAG: MBL fold metallo-hydrolase [Bacilli bacterium]